MIPRRAAASARLRPRMSAHVAPGRDTRTESVTPNLLVVTHSPVNQRVGATIVEGASAGFGCIPLPRGERVVSTRQATYLHRVLRSYLTELGLQDGHILCVIRLLTERQR